MSDSESGSEPELLLSEDTEESSSQIIKSDDSGSSSLATTKSSSEFPMSLLSRLRLPTPLGFLGRQKFDIIFHHLVRNVEKDVLQQTQKALPLMKG